MPARSRVQTIALPMRTLWNKGALTLGNAVRINSRAVARFQIGDLSREVAVFVGEIAGTCYRGPLATGVDRSFGSVAAQAVRFTGRPEAIRRLIEAGFGKAKPYSDNSLAGVRKLRSTNKSAGRAR
jgi:hypothetical protein